MERLASLAHLLLTHSLALERGELFEINSGIGAKPLVKALMKEAQTLGAMPFVRLEDDELSRLFYESIDLNNPGAMKSVFAKVEHWEKARWAHLDAHVDIGVDENDAELAGVDPEKLRLYRTAMREVRDIRIDQKRWVYLHWPTMADAQKAGMAYDDLFAFFLDAALIDYETMRADMQPLVALLERTKWVHITGEGTDLTFSIEGIPVVPCCGKRNIPDGEVYTAPVKTSVNGTITYNTDAHMLSKRYSGIRLTLRDGKIIDAVCDNDTRGLNALLDMDEGARYIGEFALGVNNAITKPIGNTLYDEKIGGSLHFTPGAAYQSAFNGNKSALHFDIVRQQRAPYGGMVYFDDVLVEQDGLFVLEELRGLNP